MLFLKATTFGTRGSEVQILSLRPLNQRLTKSNNKTDRLADRLADRKSGIPSAEIPELSTHDRDRFFQKLHRDKADCCWPWKGGSGSFGHGRFRIGKHLYSPHRIAFTIANGPIKDRRAYVLHTCDNPACCNPAHLYLGTPKDNVRDMRERGRRVTGNKRSFQPTAEQLSEILTSSESATALGERYGVHRHMINRIRRENGIDTTDYQANSRRKAEAAA